MFLRSCTIFFFYLLLVGLVIATPFNITVDDRFGSYPRIGENISYSDGWEDSGLDNCQPCHGQPPFRQAVNGTWKRSTFLQSELLDKPKIASLKFNGTAVYVNCVQSPATLAGVKGNSDVTFSLDGVVEGDFVKDAPHTQIYTTVFAKENLTPGEHTLVIQNGRQAGKYSQVMMFLDSIVYTIDDSLLVYDLPSSSTISTLPTPSSNPPQVSSTQALSTDNLHNRNVIIAGVCGTLGGMLLLSISLWLYRRFKHKRSSDLPVFSSPGSGPRWFPGRFLGPPTSVGSWHPSLFVRSKPPTTDYAPSVASSRRHMLSRDSQVTSSWIDPSIRDVPSEYDTTEASKSVRVGSMREYTNPYARRDPLMAVQEWQQRQSRIKSMELDSSVPDDSRTEISPSLPHSLATFTPPSRAVVPNRILTVVNT